MGHELADVLAIGALRSRDPIAEAFPSGPPTEEATSGGPASQLIPVMKPLLGDEEAEAAADTVRSGCVAQGPRVALFEKALSRTVGATYGVALSSATAALHLAYMLHDLGPGDEIILPSLSFIACANSAAQTGATLVFADVDPTTLNITAKTIEAVITPRTRVVLVAHQAGVPAELASIHEFCDKRGIAVIEDAACAIGSTFHGELIGSHSDLVAFSFQSPKLVNTGEGGMLMTTRGAWANRARRLREHGSSTSAADRHASSTPSVEEYAEVGFNYQMTDIQAAVGLVQLGRLEQTVARRRQLASLYSERLAWIDGLRWVSDPPYGTTNFQYFWIELPPDLRRERDEIMQSMLQLGVSTRRGIMASHLEPAHESRPRVALPVTERMASRAIILPLFHDMSEADLDRVVTSLRRAFDRVRRRATTSRWGL